VDCEGVAVGRHLFSPEAGPLVAARTRVPDHLDVPSPEVGSLLRWAAVTCRARTAVEVGSGGGISGLWLIPALGPRGMLTSIEPDPHAHGFATTAYAEAEVDAQVRAIRSEPADVLPRLSDGGYDLVILQGATVSYPAALDHARRLLRPGGILIARGVLRGGDHAEHLARFLDALANDDALTPSILPFDDGLVLATRDDDPPDGADRTDGD
jgi:predicted O-methyltransferase YrrM